MDYKREGSAIHKIGIEEVVCVYLDKGLKLERNILEGYRLIQRKDKLCKAQDSWELFEIPKQTKKLIAKLNIQYYYYLKWKELSVNIKCLYKMKKRNYLLINFLMLLVYE